MDWETGQGCGQDGWSQIQENPKRKPVPVYKRLGTGAEVYLLTGLIILPEFYCSGSEELECVNKCSTWLAEECVSASPGTMYSVGDALTKPAYYETFGICEGQPQHPVHNHAHFSAFFK